MAALATTLLVRGITFVPIIMTALDPRHLSTAVLTALYIIGTVTQTIMKKQEYDALDHLEKYARKREMYDCLVDMMKTKEL